MAFWSFIIFSVFVLQKKTKQKISCVYNFSLSLWLIAKVYAIENDQCLSQHKHEHCKKKLNESFVTMHTVKLPWMKSFASTQHRQQQRQQQQQNLCVHFRNAIEIQTIDLQHFHFWSIFGAIYSLFSCTMV